MATIQTIVTLVKVLAEAFRQTASEATYAAYEIGLEDLSDQQIKQAVHRAIREAKYMPSVKELRDMATGSSAESRPMLAWTALMQVPFNPYRHVDFDDPLVNATIRSLGGWPTFIERFTDAEAEKWVRKEFIETYSRLASSHVSGDVCRPLPGLSTGRRIERDGEVLPPLVERIELGLPTSPRIQQKTPAITGR